MNNYYIKKSIILIFLSIFGCLNSINGQDDVILNIECAEGEVGDQVCIDITVENFVDIESLEGSISFNSNALEFISFDVSGSCVSTLSGSDIVDINKDFGFLNMVWYQGPQTCPDGGLLLTLCFELIGDPGSCTPVIFDDTGIDFAVGGPNGSYVPEVVTCNNCIITNDLTIVSGYCEATEGGADGSIKFYPIGGQEPYNFTVTHSVLGLIDSGVLNDKDLWFMDNLAQGFYTIEITDATGLVVDKLISITENFPIEFDLTGGDPTCFDKNDGTAAIGVISGGQPPYQKAWSNNKLNLDQIEDLGTGNYSITVTDVTGCDAVKSLELFVDTVKAEFEIIEPFYCKGAQARVQFNGIGGAPQNGDEYEFHINGFRYGYRSEWILDDINRLKETNTFYVVDARNPNCASDEVTFTIPVLNEMTITEELIQDVVCKGDNNGRIRVTADVGTETNFLFVTESLPGETIVPAGTNGPNIYFNNDLGPGDYRISVLSNSKLCKDTFYFSITEPDEALTLNPSEDPPSCAGDDGRIEVNPTGGVPNYTYDWGILGETNNFLDNLNGGDFKVVVTDENGCQDSVEFMLLMGGELMLDANILQTISCSGDTDGSLIANVSPPDTYTFEWKDATGSILGNEQTLTGVGEGWYYVEVNSPDCMSTDSVFISNPSSLVFDDVVITPPDCPGQTGNIGVVINGGFPNYNFIWTLASETVVLGTNSVLTSVMPNTYQVVVTDQANCSIDTTITMLRPDAIDVNVSAITGVGCSGDNTGTATANASGGSTGATTFTYFWSSGEVTQTAQSLAAGEAWVIASDTKCSSDTIKFIIPDAMPVGALEQITPPSCAEDCDASITILPNGGTMVGFSVEWPDLGVTNSTIDDLCPNLYNYIVTDSDGCSFESSVVITAPDTLFLEIDSSLTKNVSCKTNTGQIATTPIGGNGNYMFQWTNDAADMAIGQDLPSGTYSIVVTDGKGCTAETSYTLDPITEITATIPNPDEPNCFGGLTCITVTAAAGGVGGPYSFQINSGPRFPLDSCVTLFAGEYKVNVFDEAGCNLDTTILISQPSQVEVELGDDIEVNIGEPSDPIEADIEMDLAMDSMSWTTLDPYDCVAFDNCTEIIVTPIQDQTVTVYVQDINGCNATDELKITVKDVRQVYFPNIFSPDDDGVNDRFQASIGPGVERINQFIVYDRWGNKMFEQTDYIPDPAFNDGWDGECNGRTVQPGVYVYYLQATFKDNRVLTYSGDITLIR